MRIPFTAAALMSLALAVPGSALAAATVVDFEALLAPTTAYSVSGVTFTSGAGGLISPVDGPNGTRVAIGNYTEDPEQEGYGVFDAYRADFAALMGFVSVDLGDWPSEEFGDDDLLFLEIFDAANVSLGRTELLIGALEPDFKTLAIGAAGISYATFGSIGNGGSSVYADNFTFDAAAIPEPSAWALMIAGFGAAGSAIRRRRSAPA